MRRRGFALREEAVRSGFCLAFLPDGWRSFIAVPPFCWMERTRLRRTSPGGRAQPNPRTVGSFWSSACSRAEPDHVLGELAPLATRILPRSPRGAVACGARSRGLPLGNTRGEVMVITPASRSRTRRARGSPPGCLVVVTGFHSTVVGDISV